jgi:hypothetical protein
MTRRVLALTVAAAFGGSMLAAAPASACQPDSPCPQTPTCRLIPKTCIYPY